MRLNADVKPFIAAMAKAEAAAKKFRDGLGDTYEPFEKETQKQKQKAPRQAEEVAGAFAKSFTRHLESAFRSLPKAAITADSTDAQLKLSTLRQTMQDLADRRIGVDINAAAALGELRAIQMELERLGTSAEIDVRADAGAALAQLQNIQREVDRLGGETARVEVDADTAAAQTKLRAVGSEASKLSGRSALIRIDADGSRALLVIAAVAAAVASLPAAATISIGVGVLGGGLAAIGLGAAGFAAAAAPAIGRVNEALQETESAAGGAGGAMKSAAQQAADSAAKALSMAQAQDRVRDAAHGVRMAQRGVGDALRDVQDRQDSLRQAQESAALAAERVSLVAEAGARRIADAERTAADAHRGTQRALEDLTRARERALERLEDLALATEGGALSEERAQISIARAKADLARVNAPGSGATALDREDADLRVREAEFALKRLKEGNADLAAEQAKANREGVEGSDEVRAAKDAVEAATRREADAERAVSDARAQAARDNAAAQRESRQASEGVARAQRDIRDALRDVADAQRAVREAERDQLRAKQQLRLEMLQQKAAMEQAGAAAGGAATKMSKLNAAERALAKDIKKFQDDYLAWQRDLQPDIFPAIRSGMTLMTAGMKAGTPLIKASAFALDTLAQKAAAGLESEQWTDFFDTMTVMAPKAIDGLGTSVGNLLGGVAGIIEALEPQTDDVLGWLKEITQEFEDWGQGLEGDSGFAKFMAYVETNAPKAEQLVGNLGQTISNLLAGSADPGAGLLDFLVSLSEELAELTPEQYEAAAQAIGMIVAAAKLGTTAMVAFFTLLTKALSEMSPGEIRAVALAIAGVIVAVKTYQAVSGAVGWYQRLAGSIGKAGDAADGAKGKFGGLAGSLKAAGIVGLVAGIAGAADNLRDELTGLNPDIDKLAKGIGAFVDGGKPAPELMDQINGKVSALDPSQWESFSQIASRLSSDNPFLSIANDVSSSVEKLSGGFITIDSAAQRMGNIDQALASMVTSGNGAKAGQMFDILAKNASEAGVPVDKLKTLLPQYTEAVGAAGTASATAAGGIDAAKQQTDGLNKSMDTFAARTDALAAIRAMETAYRDAATAIEAANGKLSISRGMTDQQRDAVIRARESFTGYIESIRVAAEGAATLSGKQTDGTRTILEQLPRLGELAGKSSEAKSQILLLAAAYGISAQDAEKAMKGGKGLKDVLAELKSKQIKIDMDTKQAQANLDNVRRTLIDIARRTDLQLKGGLNPTSALGNAWGGIQHRGGSRPDYMASGGLRSVGSSPSAMITKTPALISGRSGTDVIFGEAGWEAFIPLDSSKRGRGLQILSEAAGIMGMAVVAEKTAINGAASTSTGGSYAGSSGGAMVTVTGVDALRSALTTTTVELTDSLGTATNTLDAALGEAGTLTGAVDGLGQAATGWGEVIAVQIPPLTEAVTQLGDAISAASSGDSKGSASSKGGTKGSSKSNSKGNTGSKGDDRSPRDAAKKAEPKKTAILGATSGTSGVAMSGGPTNWAQVSRPVQSYSSGGGGSSPAPSSGASAAGGSAGQASGGGGVNVYGMVVRSEADIGQVAAQISMRRRGRG